MWPHPQNPFLTFPSYVGRVGRELFYVIHYLFHRWDIHLHKFRGDIITEILNEEDFIMEETLNDSDLKALELYRLSFLCYHIGETFMHIHFSLSY